MFDNLLWATNEANRSKQLRIGAIYLYFTWWLCQDKNRPLGTPKHHRVMDETGPSDKHLGLGTALDPSKVFSAVPENTKSLFWHWVEKPTHLI